MKRKIYQTPHGRVILKITCNHKGKFQAVLSVTFRRYLISPPALKIRSSIEYTARNRRVLLKGFKSFDEDTAAGLAKLYYKHLPDIMKAPQ